MRFACAVPSCFGCLFACRAFCAHIFLLSFAFSFLAFAAQTSFHLSLRPRRASTFFRKESRQRFARGRGSAPFEPPFLRPAANLPFPRAAGRLSGPLGRKPPADRETLEKPRSRAQLFKRFCAKGDACALSPISPFLSLLAGLSGPSGRKSPADGETPEKPRSRAQLFGRFCAWGNGWPHVFIIYESLARAFARQASSRPEETGARPFSLPGKTEAVRRARTWNEPRACAAWTQTQTRCATCSPQVCPPQCAAGRETPEKPRSTSSAFRAFLCVGERVAPRFSIYESLARAFARQASSRPQGTGARPFSLPGKTGAMRGRAPGNGRVRARLGKDTNPVRELPTAGVPAAAARACEDERRHKKGKPLCGRPPHKKLHRG